MSVLPELSDLTNTAYNDSDFAGNLYTHINAMRILASFVVLVVGLVWVVRVFLYFLRVRRDDLFMSELSRAYEEKILPKEGIFVRRAVKTAFGCLLCAAFLTLDFRMEHFNLMPDILAAVAFWLFFLFIRKRVCVAKARTTVILSLYTVSCIGSIVAQILFFDRFSYRSVIRNDEALALFRVLMIAEIIKAVLLVATMLCVLDVLRRTIQMHTGFVVGQSIETEAAQRQMRSVQKELGHTLIYVLVATILYAVSDVCYEWLIGSYGFMGLINMIFGLLFVGFVFRAQNEISSAVDTKYMLE